MTCTQYDPSKLQGPAPLPSRARNCRERHWPVRARGVARRIRQPALHISRPGACGTRPAPVSGGPSGPPGQRSSHPQLLGVSSEPITVSRACQSVCQPTSGIRRRWPGSGGCLRGSGGSRGGRISGSELNSAQ